MNYFNSYFISKYFPPYFKLSAMTQPEAIAYLKGGMDVSGLFRRRQREKARAYDEEVAHKRRVWLEDEEAVATILAFLEAA